MLSSITFLKTSVAFKRYHISVVQKLLKTIIALKYLYCISNLSVVK